MKCRSTGNCIFPSDDAHRIGNLLQSCDVLVVGTPVYWGGMNGKLKEIPERILKRAVRLTKRV
ncbi:MAG: flavodoxin family protein [Treponema sp.]|uniref:NAD(P)H-dependent oxidoreductase n=1 Tax=Treponema sp. TaxID=166 RepID=UPI00298DD62E|nr:NAD(P)H-dependent oxidoreductase [Treponema sp.]MBR5932785.1 flavodoxin family protein [Treponema sp.]